MEKFLDTLKQSPLFERIADADLHALLSCLGAKSVRYGKGELILREGDAANHLGVVLSGGVQVIRVDYYGNRSMMAKLDPGDLFAEAFACAEIPTMPVNVLACDNTEVLLIDAYRITHPCGDACGHHSQIIYNLMKILAAKNLMCNQKIEITSKRSTREKLLSYLTIQAQKANSNHFSIPYDRQELADYLEVDRSGLSAEISKLRKEGVLNCEKNRFTLLK